MNKLASLPEQLEELAKYDMLTEEQQDTLLDTIEELRRQQDEIYSLSNDIDHYLNEITELREMVEELRGDIECLERTGRHR